MNPRVVTDRQGLLAMFRHRLADQPHLAEQLEAIIAAVESNTAVADGVLKGLMQKDGGQAGFFNQLSLSTLPFVAISQIKMQILPLLHRVRIYGEKIGSVVVVVTPDDEVYAKAFAHHCQISLGLVNVVYCVCLYLFCLQEGMSLSGEGLMVSDIHQYRASFLSFLNLQIKTNVADQFVGGNFRCDSYRPFVEGNQILEKLGVERETVDACLKSNDSVSVLLAFILASLCVRFIALHEVAHHHYGHSQLLEIWRERPDVAEELMKSGFPSPDARRAMESFADVWAAEMLIVSEIFSDSSVLSDDIVVGRLTPLTRAKVAFGAIELTFHILLAVDSATSGENAWWNDFGATLKGKIDTMYPGGASRAAYARKHGGKRAAENHPYLRWTRWRRMKKEMAAIDSGPASMAISQLWQACSLGGGMFPVKRGDYAYFPKMSAKDDNEDKDDRESWHPWDRFDYIRAHEGLSRDLLTAKKWAAGKR
jgi:hypothetical protein